MSKNIKVPGRNNVVLVLDETDEATPAMVYAGPPKSHQSNSIYNSLGQYSSSYDCATGTGCVGSNEEIELTEAQVEFLTSDAVSDQVEGAYEVARPEGWS